MRRLLILTLAALLLVLAACVPKPYEPAGEPTGNAALDDAVLSLLQERCSAKNSEQENLRAVGPVLPVSYTHLTLPTTSRV